MWPNQVTRGVMKLQDNVAYSSYYLVCKTTTSSLVSRALWVRNLERASQGQLWFAPQCLEPQLGSGYWMAGCWNYRKTLTNVSGGWCWNVCICPPSGPSHSMVVSFCGKTPSRSPPVIPTCWNSQSCIILAPCVTHLQPIKYDNIKGIFLPWLEYKRLCFSSFPFPSLSISPSLAILDEISCPIEEAHMRCQWRSRVFNPAPNSCM
jgi:hypothetical protein